MKTHVLALALLVVSAGSPVQAAEIRCLDHGKEHMVAPRPETAQSTKRYYSSESDYCQQIGLIGPIVSGDAEALQNFLVELPNAPFSLILNSPGGSMLEGIRLGRIIRSYQLSVSAGDYKSLPVKVETATCGIEHRPVCCASACAIAYLGGGRLQALDYLGLHRPTTADLGDHAYEKSKQLLRETSRLISEYMNEMEVDRRYLDAMMSAAPERIAVVRTNENDFVDNDPIYIYPPSIHDWLSSKCKHKKLRPPEEFQSCMDDEFRTQQDALHFKNKSGPSEEEPTDEPQLHEEVSVQQLKEAYLVLDAERRDKAKRMAPERYEKYSELRDRLEAAIIEDKKPKIDAMDAMALMEYLRETWQSKELLNIPGEDEIQTRAFKRLEELTGDRIIGDQIHDCQMALDPNSKIQICSTLIASSANDRRLLLGALSARGDARIKLNDREGAIRDYTSALAVAPTASIYTNRAIVRSSTGDDMGAIEDFTRAIELEPSFTSYQMRAESYKSAGDLARAEQDRAKARELLNANSKRGTSSADYWGSAPISLEPSK